MSQSSASNSKPRLAFFGSPDFAVPILEALAAEHEIALVVTQPDKPVGKGLQLQASPVAQSAEALGLKVVKPNRLKDEDFRAVIESLEVDLMVVAAYGKILPQWLLDWPKSGAINVHGSLLPKYRGASPIASAILNGDSVTGITMMLMNAGMDEGDMLKKFELPIESDDTTQTLSTKMSRLSAEVVSEVVQDYLAGALQAEAQDSNLASYAPLLSKADGQIDFHHPPANLSEMIRAYSPWPGVWGMFQQKRVKLLPDDFVQMEGKKSIKRVDFIHGYPDFPINF